MSKQKKVLIFLLVIFSIFARVVYANNSNEVNNDSNPYQEEQNQSRSVSNEVRVEYEYNDEKNQVVAKIISAIQLKNTKPTWNLSEDGLTYTKVFSKNEAYITPVIDINDNVTVLEINVEDVREFNPNVSYEYIQGKNQVLVKITSNVKFLDTKPTWNLSNDKYTYTKVFYDNQKYHTTVTDISGNSQLICIDVKDVQVFKPYVEYNYDEDNNTVTATIKSNVMFAATKPTWNLSEDKLVYTKVFFDNEKYTTVFTDMNGNNVVVSINISQIDDMPPEISTEYKFNKDGTVTMYLKSNKELADTKPTWNLSEDKLVYEKDFDSTQKYITSVQAKNGKSTIVCIDIKLRQDVQKQQDGTIINIRYLCKAGKSVEVQVTGSEGFYATKPTWKLSENSEVYSKDFEENTVYTTPFQFADGKTYIIPIIVIDLEEEKTGKLKGIDVSGHQGVIDWIAVKNSGVDFAILRCGYGENISSQDDSYFVRNMSECERLGIKYGVYLYSYALNENGAISEANHVLRLIKGHSVPLGVWFDMEDADGYKQRNGMPSDETLVNICKIFCDRIRDNGYEVGIYASYYWLTTILNNGKLDSYDKWVAQWSNRCSYTKPYKMWQYTSTGTVNGVNGNVDMNYLYK